MTPEEFAKKYHDLVHAAATAGEGPDNYWVWSWDEMKEGNRRLLILAAERFLATEEVDLVVTNTITGPTSGTTIQCKDIQGEVNLRGGA